MVKLTLTALAVSLAACSPPAVGTPDTPVDPSPTDTGDPQGGEPQDTGAVADPCNEGLSGGAQYGELTSMDSYYGSLWVTDNCAVQVNGLTADLTDLGTPRIVLNDYNTYEQYIFDLEPRIYDGEDLQLVIGADEVPWGRDPVLQAVLTNADYDPVLASIYLFIP